MQNAGQQDRNCDIPMPPMGDSHPYSLPNFYASCDFTPPRTPLSSAGFYTQAPFNGGTMTNPLAGSYPMPPGSAGFYDPGHYTLQASNPYFPNNMMPPTYYGYVPGGIPLFMPATPGGFSGEFFFMNLLQMMQSMMQQMSSMLEHMHKMMHTAEKEHDTFPLPPVPPLDHAQEKYPHLPAAATPQWLNTLISG